MKHILSTALAVILSFSLGLSALAIATDPPPASVYAFDVLDQDTTTALSGEWELPVVSGLLGWVEDTYTITNQTFTLGSDNESGTYQVSATFNNDSGNINTQIWLGLAFTEVPDSPPVISSLTENADITADIWYSGYYDYGYTAAGSGDPVYCYYFVFTIDGRQNTADTTFALDFPDSASSAVRRTLELTLTRLDPDALDFNQTLQGEQALHDGSDNSRPFFNGIGLLPYGEGTGESAVYGTVNGYPALAVCDTRSFDFSMAFESSEYDKLITSLSLYDANGDLSNWCDDHHRTQSALYDADENVVGYMSDTCEIGTSVGEEDAPQLLVATNEIGLAYPIVLLRVHSLAEGETLALPEWQEAWDDVLAWYDLYTAAIPVPSDDNNGLSAERAEEETFWEALPPMANETLDGGTVSFDAKFYENIPHWVVDDLAEKNITLTLTYRDSSGAIQSASIDCAKVAKTQSARIFYSIADFVALYQA